MSYASGDSGVAIKIRPQHTEISQKGFNKGGKQTQTRLIHLL